MVRNKWKALRDKFRTTLASIPKPKSGDPAIIVYKGQWKHFQSLLFLKDQFAPRSHGGNFNIDEDDSNTCSSQKSPDEEDITDTQESTVEQVDEEEIAGVSTLHSTTPSTSRPSSTSENRDTSTKKKRSSRDNVGLELLDIEKRKMQYLQEKLKKKTDEEEDEDLAFFKSLLPHVKKLSAYDKMSYRMQILRTTQEFLKPTNITATNQGDTGDNAVVTVHSAAETSARNYYSTCHTDLLQDITNSFLRN